MHLTVCVEGRYEKQLRTIWNAENEAAARTKEKQEKKPCKKLEHGEEVYAVVAQKTLFFFSSIYDDVVQYAWKRTDWEREQNLCACD